MSVNVLLDAAPTTQLSNDSYIFSREIKSLI